MSITSLKVKIQALAQGPNPSSVSLPYPWSIVESSVNEYITQNSAAIMSEKLNGMETTPRAIFSRTAESIGYQVQFLNSNSFIFSKKG